MWIRAAEAHSTPACALTAEMHVKHLSHWLATTCNTKDGVFLSIDDVRQAGMGLGLELELAADVAFRLWAGLANDGSLPVQRLLALLAAEIKQPHEDASPATAAEAAAADAEVTDAAADSPAATDVPDTSDACLLARNSRADRHQALLGFPGLPHESCC